MLHADNLTVLCEYDVDDDSHLSQVTCQQTLDLQASFSLAVSMHVRQSVKLVEVHDANTDAPVLDHNYKSTTLQYELGTPGYDSSQPSTSDLQLVQTALQDMVQHTHNTVSAVAPHQFSKLVSSLRAVNKAKIAQLYHQLVNCSPSYCDNTNHQQLLSVYMDGLVACGTGPCLNVITTAIEHGDAAAHHLLTLLYTMAAQQTPNTHILNKLQVRSLTLSSNLLHLFLSLIMPCDSQLKSFY